MCSRGTCFWDWIPPRPAQSPTFWGPIKAFFPLPLQPGKWEEPLPALQEGAGENLSLRPRVSASIPAHSTGPGTWKMLNE